MKTATAIEPNPLFLDVFRRADKNDDGRIDKEEFIAYFEDDLLSHTELEKVFEQIDKSKDQNIEITELCDFFGQGFDHFLPLFQAMVSTNVALSSVLDHTAKTYPATDQFHQFRCRFYLREFMSQLRSLHLPLEFALDHLTGSNEPTPPVHVQTPRPTHQDRDESPNIHSPLDATVEKLARLVEKLSSNPLRLDTDNCINNDAPTSSLIVCRNFTVEEADIQIFLNKTRSYFKQLKSVNGLKHTYAKQLSQTDFLIYEVWASEDNLKKHYASPLYKEYTKKLVDILAEPATTQTMLIPSEWLDNEQ